MNDKNFWDNFFKWVRETLPNLLAAFGVGFKLGESGKNKVEAELDKVKTDLELKENEIQNEKEFSGKSDADIIHDALGESGESKPKPE